MVWKPKERELTKEEAIEEARKTLAPFWYHTKPLFMASVLEGKVRIFPIDDSFSQQSWMIALLDPFSPVGITALRYINQLHQRHNPHDLKTCVVLRSPFEFARDRSQIDALLAEEDIQFPVVLDSDGQLHRGFEVENLSGVSYRLYDQADCKSRAEGEAAPVAWEKELQNFLRARDPGLSLRPILDPHPFDIRVKSIAFTPKAKSASPLIDTLGEWKEEGSGIYSQDSQAAIELDVPSRRLFLLAEKKGKSSGAASLRVTLNGVPVFPEDRGSGLVEGDDGRTLILLKKASVVEVLQSHQPSSGVRRLRIEALSSDDLRIILHRLFIEGV